MNITDIHEHICTLYTSKNPTEISTGAFRHSNVMLKISVNYSLLCTV